MAGIKNPGHFFLLLKAGRTATFNGSPVGLLSRQITEVMVAPKMGFSIISLCFVYSRHSR